MNLIKRGGGTGPMKPGNQLLSEVPIPAVDYIPGDERKNQSLFDL